MNAEAVARARACIGVRFRPQGRSAATGLDCVGLAAAAFDVVVDADYALRGEHGARIAAGLQGAGFRTVKQSAPGDLWVVSAGPAQLHLGIFAGGSLIHADAGIGRVVERPLPLPWPIVAMWRKEGEG